MLENLLDLKLLLVALMVLLALHGLDHHAHLEGTVPFSLKWGHLHVATVATTSTDGQS